MALSKISTKSREVCVKNGALHSTALVFSDDEYKKEKKMGPATSVYTSHTWQMVKNGLGCPALPGWRLKVSFRSLLISIY